LFDLQQDVLIARVTSVPHTEVLDIPISEWRLAGLEKPSVVRLTRIVAAEKTLLRLQIGRLSAVDLEKVRSAWNQHMRL